ncbi:hypothetical protein FACS189499_09720 [Clostridia bacterium]|nr:hypothetical protein FACS189499_09720 [Clostridia bacterium]
MTNLISAEWLKIRKSLGFWILCGASAAMSALIVVMFQVYESEIPIGELLTGVSGFYQSLGQIQSNIILVSVLASIFVCGEFANRTFGISLFSGYSRRKLMAAKLIMLFIGAIILTSVMPLIMTTSFSVTNGFSSDTLSSENVLRDLGLYYLGILTLASFCAFLTYVIKSVGGSIGAGIGIGMVFAIAGSVPVEGLQQVLKFTFFQQLAGLGSPDIDVPLYICVMVVSLAVILVASIAVFEKSDLK